MRRSHRPATLGLGETVRRFSANARVAWAGGGRHCLWYSLTKKSPRPHQKPNNAFTGDDWWKRSFALSIWGQGCSSLALIAHGSGLRS